MHLKLLPFYTTAACVRLGTMSTLSSARDAARVVVELDFGTTFSGFAFAHMSDPHLIYIFYDWPVQTKGLKCMATLVK